MSDTRAPMTPLQPCGASTFLEGYGMVHCDQPKEHGGKHCGPLYTEHEWEQGS